MPSRWTLPNVHPEGLKTSWVGVDLNVPPQPEVFYLGSLRILPLAYFGKISEAVRSSNGDGDADFEGVFRSRSRLHRKARGFHS
jgi:hypothetical protein